MKNKLYQPPKIILEKYADVLVNFALNSGRGIKKGETVFLSVMEAAKPLLIELHKAVLKAGGHTLVHYIPDGLEKNFFDFADDRQIGFFPAEYLKGRVEQMDHSILILAETDLHELEGVDPKMIMDRQRVFKPYMEWRNKKENAGKFSWSIALYGTPAGAAEAGLTEREYWAEIIKACYLNDKEPVKTWCKIKAEVERIKARLDALKIERVRIESQNIDLVLALGRNRRWLGGTGANIPGFEIFISPDCRWTEGHIYFNQPIYSHGNLIKDVYLEFKNGRVIKARAKKGEKILKEMIANKNADMIGEFSLTDSRLSKITKFMAETLYDENIGGPYGNTHIALGSAYKDSYPGKLNNISAKQWKKMGYNESVVHTDFISTENRTVTAWLPDGQTLVIYKDGKFTI